MNFKKKWSPHYLLTTSVREIRENNEFESDLDALLKEEAEKAWNAEANEFRGTFEDYWNSPK